MFAVAAVGALAGARGAAATPAPEALLQRAFDRTLNAPGVRSMELRIHRGGQLVSRRAFDIAYRREHDAAQSLVRFTAPAYLRGHALLVLATPTGASDTWLYQAEERRPRRVGATHKADAFYGSDLSFEDLEHQRYATWRVRRLPDDAADGASHVVVEAVPPGGSQYDRLVVWIDAARTAVARVDFHRGDGREPMKRLTVTLDGVAEEAGHLLVRHMRIEQIGRDAWTDVETRRIAVDPGISPELFSASVLEREGDDLYELATRHARAPSGRR
ncbi:MAG: hypothetical protein DCC71_13090 [Proteobacteria bacterium]|nr:MAG: hypothetical protein DCC71_13090 [Pseudomonadota bacterium]